MGCGCHPGHVLQCLSHVRVNGQYSEEFGMGVGVYQGSVLSPLLFILVLEAVLCEFRTGAPWGLLYVDDWVLIMDTQEECISKLKTWKAGMESKGLCVIKYPCAVCCRGVGNNYIQCSQCMLSVHKKCNCITKQLVADSNYVRLRCKGGSRPIDG